MGICGSSAGGEINPDKVDSSHFDTQRVVGKGGFGKVNACVKLSVAGGDKDVWYAMKVMSKRVALKRKMTDEFFMERAMLAQVKHEFLCNAQYCFQDESYCYICLDLALGGDIKWHMRQTKNPAQGALGMIPDDLAKFYLAQIACALDYLHQKKIIHRDIKPENVVLVNDGYCKLTDFGVSQSLNSKGMYHGSSGTPGYRAPEMLSKSKDHGPPADWFALGVAMSEMVTGWKPYENNNHTRVEGKGKKWDSIELPVRTTQAYREGNDHPSWNPAKKIVRPNAVPADMEELITFMVDPNPDARCGTLDDLKGSKWYKGFDWRALNAKTLAPPFIPDTTTANCELDSSDLEKGLYGDSGANDIPPEHLPVPTEAEQKTFEGYDWNITVADLLEGKREKLKSVLGDGSQVVEEKKE